MPARTKPHLKEENVLNCAIYIIAPHRRTVLTGEVRQTVIVTSEDHQAPLVECPRLSSLNKIRTLIYIQYMYWSSQLFECRLALMSLLSAERNQVSHQRHFSSSPTSFKSSWAIDNDYRGDDVQSNTHKGPIRGVAAGRWYKSSYNGAAGDTSGTQSSKGHL